LRPNTAHPRLISRRPKAATNAFTRSAAIAARRSMPVRWTTRRAMACVSGQSHSAPPSHQSDKDGGVPRCIGWMRSLPCLPPRKAGQAEQRLLHSAAASPDAALLSTRYSATDLAGCGKSRHLGKMVMKRARNGNSGLIKSVGYEDAKGDELGSKRHRPTFSAAC
jgi:hypothetical protein